MQRICNYWKMHCPNYSGIQVILLRSEFEFCKVLHTLIRYGTQ